MAATLVKPEQQASAVVTQPPPQAMVAQTQMGVPPAGQPQPPHMQAVQVAPPTGTQQLQSIPPPMAAQPCVPQMMHGMPQPVLVPRISQMPAVRPNMAGQGSLMGAAPARQPVGVQPTAGVMRMPLTQQMAPHGTMVPTLATTEPLKQNVQHQAPQADQPPTQPQQPLGHRMPEQQHLPVAVPQPQPQPQPHRVEINVRTVDTPTDLTPPPEPELDADMGLECEPNGPSRQREMQQQKPEQKENSPDIVVMTEDISTSAPCEEVPVDQMSSEMTSSVDDIKVTSAQKPSDSEEVSPALVETVTDAAKPTEVAAEVTKPQQHTQPIQVELPVKEGSVEVDSKPPVTPSDNGNSEYGVG